MPYTGLLDDEEIFQCTFLLILGIVLILGALVTILFVLINIPYSRVMLIAELIFGTISLLKFRELEDGIKTRQKEFEAHERKENKELET